MSGRLAMATQVLYRKQEIDAKAKKNNLCPLPLIHKRYDELCLCTSGGGVRPVRTGATHELGSSFSRIHQLPLLETINLKFFRAHGHQLDSNNEGRLTLQASILGALAASFSFRAPPKLIPSRRTTCPLGTLPPRFSPTSGRLGNPAAPTTLVLVDNSADLDMAL